MKNKTIRLIVFLAIPLAAGGLASLLVGSDFSAYAAYEKPPLSPPGWLFPVVWTALYALMGYASYLVYQADAPDVQRFQALCLYFVQLAVNFTWPIFFFRWQLLLSSFFVLLLLWLLVAVTMRLFSDIHERPGTLLLPYLLWITYAGYLNFGIFRLN